MAITRRHPWLHREGDHLPVPRVLKKVPLTHFVNPRAANILGLVGEAGAVGDEAHVRLVLEDDVAVGDVARKRLLAARGGC
jgi:hypothetical protein